MTNFPFLLLLQKKRNFFSCTILKWPAVPYIIIIIIIIIIILIYTIKCYVGITWCAGIPVASRPFVRIWSHVCLFFVERLGGKRSSAKGV